MQGRHSGNGVEQEGSMHNRWTITQGSAEWGKGELMVLSRQAWVEWEWEVGGKEWRLPSAPTQAPWEVVDGQEGWSQGQGWGVLAGCGH